MQRFSTLVAVLLGLLMHGPASAASGTALGVDPDAKLEAGRTIKTLVVGTDVFIGDRVITDANGLVQIRFSDRTELVVGPRSALLIEDYLLREDGSGGRFAVNALSGTFRFVTGGAPKDRYLISTPTGTIGVRGTGFDFSVQPDHTSLLLYHGVVVLCNLANQCVTLDGLCEVGMFDTSQAQILGNTDQFVGAERNSMRGMFPYAVSEAALRSDFWIAQARSCLNRAVVVPQHDPVSTTSDTDDEQRPRENNDNTSGGVCTTNVCR